MTIPKSKTQKNTQKKEEGKLHLLIDSLKSVTRPNKTAKRLVRVTRARPRQQLPQLLLLLIHGDASTVSLFKIEFCDGNICRGWIVTFRNTLDLLAFVFVFIQQGQQRRSP